MEVKQTQAALVRAKAEELNKAIIEAKKHGLEINVLNHIYNQMEEDDTIKVCIFEKIEY